MALTASLSAVDWGWESYPAYQDFVFLPVLVLFFPIFRFFLDRFVFEKMARKLVIRKECERLDFELEGRKKVHKFKESAWKCLYFLSGEILSLYVTYDEPWFKSTRYFWEGPGDQVWPDQKIKFKLKAAYMYAAGFYTYSIFALMFWETKRSDFGVSMSHHVATALLILLSYIFSYEVLLTLDKEKHKFDGPLYYHIFNTLLFFYLYFIYTGGC
ncbi:hypothetical protein HPP92_018525 [Vanilla planifolia]|uniref:TLC domain-containing protein n=1 Tax=Vanilla planifolia TaxID=51239 RepID=A0A835QK79_VANPL|nr:hypothetical protein HPP92_018525 [Vanilla planifolia]